MNLEWSRRITEVLIAWAIALQTIEMISLHQTFGIEGIWSWETLRPELGSILGLFLKGKQFLGVLAIQLVLAVALLLFPAPAWTGLLLFTDFLVCYRWRGTFNGGSDYMTILILAALCIPLPKIALGYIAIQSCLSYFIAGLAKVRFQKWRNGEALAVFLNSQVYPIPKNIRSWSSSRTFCYLGGWGVLFFELGFPLCFLNRQICLVFLISGSLFHLINAYALGINRFFWAWVASYPAIFYFAGYKGFLLP